LFDWSSAADNFFIDYSVEVFFSYSSGEPVEHTPGVAFYIFLDQA